MIYIGQIVIYNKKIYHVQDVDYLQGTAKIGIPDENDIIWEHKWTEFDSLSKVESVHLPLQNPVLIKTIDIDSFPSVCPLEKPNIQK